MSEMPFNSNHEQDKLDPYSKAFMEKMHASGNKPFYELPVPEARKRILELHKMIDGPPLELHKVTDQTIPVPGGSIGVRIYHSRPAVQGELLPIVINIHGGGFVIGDLDTNDRMARYYCKHADVIVVGIDYRRPPEHKFPVAVDDSYAALCWVAEHARDLGGDASRIAVVGESVGATLCTVLCQLSKSRKGPRIAFQVLAYPVTDFDRLNDYPSQQQYGGEFFPSNQDMEWCMSLYFAESQKDIKDPRASPILAPDLLNLPPALIVTAGFDPVRDQGKAYADQLAAAGIPVEYHCFKNTIHAFMSFNNMIPAGKEGLALVAARLRSILHGNTNRSL